MNTYLFLGNIGVTEIIIIGLIVLLLFGGKKIPELMKGLGKGVKSFKEGINDIEEDINNLCEYLPEYENSDFDFQEWIKDNGLEEAYKEYIKYF